MKKKAVVCNSRDNVATALEDIKKDSLITVNTEKSNIKIKIENDIKLGHKFALKYINKEDQIIKYGESIGTAISEIKKGEWVHIHNLESNRGRGDIGGKTE